MSKLTLLGVLAISGVAIGACGGNEESPAPRAAAASAPVQAEPGDHTADETAAPPGAAGEGTHADASEHAAGSASQAGSAWSALNALRDDIARVVAEGKLSEVHEKSERLGPLGDALRAGAAGLPDDKRTRVEAALAQLPRVASALHEAADAGNAEATRRELGRLDGVLTLLRTHYPADALEAAPAPGAGPAHGAEAGGAHAGHAPEGHAHAARPLAAVDEPATATIRVVAGEFEFEPRTLTLRAGEPTRIELENDGAVDHALIVQASDGNGDLIHLHALARATDAGTFRIDQRGRYRVLCTIPGHTEAGMVGELVVQ